MYLQDTTDVWNDICIVFEMAHKGVLMDVEAGGTVTPYSEEMARHFFRDMILGIEYRKDR